MSEPAGIKTGGAEDGTSLVIADGAPVEQRKEDPPQPPAAAASVSRKGAVATKSNEQGLVAIGAMAELRKKDPRESQASAASNPISREEVAETMATAPALIARKQVRPKPQKPQASTTSDRMSRKASTTSTTTDSEAPSGMEAITANNKVLTNTAKTNQVLFDPFVSLRFNEIKLATCAEKAWNVHQVNKRMLNLVNRFIPIYNSIARFTALMMVIFIFYVMSSSLEKIFQDGGILSLLILVAFIFICLWVLDFILTIWFNITADPMKILIEARDIMGATSYFIITDKRSRASRMFKMRRGGKMELARLEDPNNPILTTSTTMLGAPGLFGCCCCMCFITNKVKLERVGDGVTLASYELYRCCGYAQPRITLCRALCCEPVRTTLYCASGKVDFVQPLACNRHDGNVIGPSETQQPNQVAVQKNAFSCEDFFFETVDLLGVDDTIGDTFEDAVGEDAADAVDAFAAAKEAKEIKDDYEDALSDFKEKGYKKLGTSSSIWDVNFPPGMDDHQKCAVVLFVLKQYAYDD